MNPKDRLIVALDVDTMEKALSIVDKLKHDVRYFKVGFELFSSCGPDIVKAVRERDAEIFLDLKFHDIPNTVAKAAAAVTGLGVFMFNLHASGGVEMMRRAREAVDKECEAKKIGRPHILGVTVLTSMDGNGLKKIGVHDTIKDQVLRLAGLVKEAGLDGVVASPEETAMLRREFGEEFLIVTPGVRPKWSAIGDQKRIATPKDAVASGASFIVVGRPILDAKDMREAAKEIIIEIGS